MKRKKKKLFIVLHSDYFLLQNEQRDDEYVSDHWSSEGKPNYCFLWCFSVFWCSYFVNIVLKSMKYMICVICHVASTIPLIIQKLLLLLLWLLLSVFLNLLCEVIICRSEGNENLIVIEMILELVKFTRVRKMQMMHDK